MGQTTKIEWSSHTFNPWYGCQKVSSACVHCYAETMSNRQLHKKKYGVQHLWGPTAMRRIAEDEKWEEPLYWNRQAEKRNTRAQVFCGSMCDVMEDRRDLDAPRQRLYQLIEQTPFLDWLLVTKRPENLSKFLPQSWRSSPKPNVWLMTTCENQECADKRIPELMKVPAVVYGISVEPMLGPITLPQGFVDLGRSGWVITGGETGCAARPTQEKWLTDLRDQCVSHGVAYVFKKWGKFYPSGNNVLVKLTKTVKEENPRVEHVLDGREWNELPAPNQSYLEKRDQVLYECAVEL